MRRLGLAASENEIKALYSKFDANNNGGLDMGELRTFLGRMKVMAEAMMGKQQALNAAGMERAGLLRYRATVMTAALMAEVEAQQQEKLLEELNKSVPVEAKLAELLVKKKMAKANSMLRSWSTSKESRGRGLTLAEFKKGVRPSVAPCLRPV